MRLQFMDYLAMFLLLIIRLINNYLDIMLSGFPQGSMSRSHKILFMALLRMQKVE